MVLFNNILFLNKGANTDMSDRAIGEYTVKKSIKIYTISLSAYTFIEFQADLKKLNKHEFYNKVFNYSLRNIPLDIGVKFKNRIGPGKGVARSFFLNKITNDLFEEKYNYYKDLYALPNNAFLSKGNFMDLIIYFYLDKFIDKDILNHFNFEFSLEKKRSLKEYPDRI